MEEKERKRNEKREPRSRSYRSDPRIYDTRLFRNREEKRGYPPRGGVATRQIGFAFGGTPVYFIGYVRYIHQNGALLSELWKKFEMKRSLWKKITQRILFFQLARKKLYAIELWNWKELVKSSSNLRFESELINIIISPDFSYDFYALIHSMIKHGINKVDKNFI